jgi:hypothetical protein
MKYAVLLVAFCLLSIVPVMAGGSKEPAPLPATPVEQPSTQTAPAPTPVQLSNPFYTGSGGNGSSIAILPLKGVGLEANLAYLPTLVQGEFVSNFSAYSAIRVLDRVTLDDQFDELLSGYYPDDMEGVISLGHMLPTTYIMVGRITKTAIGYALQITIAKTSDGTTEASYSGACTFAELDNFTGIRRASLELLGRMGVALTEQARTELSGSATQQAVNAQTALAQGITAQRSGTEVAALSYYYQAAAFDPSLLEAVNRASVLTANITSGNIGSDVRNDIQWRRDWVNRLTETEQYFDNFLKTSLPPFILYYATTLERGRINYQTEIIPLSFTVNLHTLSIWFTAVQDALHTILNGLNATGRKEDWGLSRWPETGVTSLAPFTNYRKDFTIIFELVNDQNRVISRQTINIGSQWRFTFRNGITLEYSAENVQIITFNAVKANDIIDTLSIRIASVNGADPQIAVQRNSLQIISGINHLFPLDGVTPGKTTVQELARMGVRSTTINDRTNLPYTYYTINGIKVWYDEETSFARHYVFLVQRPITTKMGSRRNVIG